MAAVASLLDNVAAFAEGRTDLLWDTEVFPLNSHPVEADGMTALPKVGQFLFVAFPAFLRKDHGLLFGSGLVVDVARDAMDPFLCVFRLRPGLENSRRHPLMTIHTESRVDGLFRLFKRADTHDERRTHDEEKKDR
jgi:hypothetical protein